MAESGYIGDLFWSTGVWSALSRDVVNFLKAFFDGLFFDENRHRSIFEQKMSRMHAINNPRRKF